MTKRILAVLLALMVMTAALAGCGGGAGSGTSAAQPASTAAADADAGQSSAQPAADGETYEFMWMGWGAEDYMGGSLHTYCEQMDAELDDVVWSFSDAFNRGADAMVTEAEAAALRGVDAIICIMPSAALMDVCEKNEVYLGGACMAITDEELIAHLEASPYWLGCNPHGGDFEMGYQSAKHLYENGCKNVVLISQPAGTPSPDLRLAGMQQFIEETEDMNSLGEYLGANKPEGLSNLISLHGDAIDGALLTGVSRGGLEGCANAIESAGLDIKLACIDMSESTGVCFESGRLLFAAGGNNIDAGSMTVIAHNAASGNYEGPVYMYPDFIVCTSAEQYEEYMTYVEGDVPAFTGEELRQYMRAYNPDATDEAYVEYIETEFTLESIMERHAGMV